MQAETSFNESYRFYFVKVAQLKNLLGALNKASPIREDGEIYHGSTDTHVNWKFNWRENDGVCRITSVDTEVQASYTLPKLDIENSNKEILGVWEKYYSALLLHEKGHADIAIAAANEIEDKLANLFVREDCVVLERKANELAEAIVDRYIPKHKIYDVETKHGKTQGADAGLYINH